MAEVRGSPEPLNIPDRNEEEVFPPGPMSMVFEILGTDNIDYHTVHPMFTRPLNMAIAREDNEIREKLTKFIEMTREIYPELSEEQLKIINSLESIINKTITLPNGDIIKAPIDRKHLNKICFSLNDLYDKESLNRNQELAIPILKKIFASFSFVPGVNPTYGLLTAINLPKERLLEVGNSIEDEEIKIYYFSDLALLGKISEEESILFAESISNPALKSAYFLQKGYHYVHSFFDYISTRKISDQQREEFFQTLMNKANMIQNEELSDELLTEVIFSLNDLKLFEDSVKIISEIKNKELKDSLEALMKLTVTVKEELSLENAIEITSKIKDGDIRGKALKLILDSYPLSKSNENFSKILALLDTIYNEYDRTKIEEIIKTLH